MYIIAIPGYRKTLTSSGTYLFVEVVIHQHVLTYEETTVSDAQTGHCAEVDGCREGSRDFNA